MTDTSKSRALPVPSKRLSRFGRLGGMTAGIAGNMAVNGIAQLGQGKRPAVRDLLLTPRNISRVADQLAQMRGAAMKIGQLVSMDTGDVLPPELAQIMARLRDDAHFMPAAQLKQVLNRQWGAHWLRSFRKFDVHPIAAASIGQVHRAQLKDGRDLAIKVQYPGVADSIDSDVANVGALIRMSGLLPKGFEIASYLEEGRKQLHEETDYKREGENLMHFERLLAGTDGFAVPSLIPEWSTPETLAMTFRSGTPIEEVTDLPQDQRNMIAHRLIELTLREMFEFVVMQTDPNFANYLYDRATSEIVLLDFGATRHLDPAIVDQYRRLMQAGLAADESAILHAAKDMGFLSKETKPEHRAEIIKMIGLVFAALRETPRFDFTDMSLSRQMQAEGMVLAESGFVPPPLPIDVLLVQRKLGGVFLLANRLGATADVLSLLERYVHPA